MPQPDLAVMIKGDTVWVLSPWLGRNSSARYQISRAFQIFSHSTHRRVRGEDRNRLTRERAADEAKGFGATLYDNYAPDVFKAAFWRLVQLKGDRFHTIQIYSDKPDIPWELMRPMRPDGTGRQDFLGLNYSVARWETNDGPVRDHPPYHRACQKCS